MNGSYLSLLPSNYKAILFCLNLWYIPIDYGKIHHQQHKFYIDLIAWSIGFCQSLRCVSHNITDGFYFLLVQTFAYLIHPNTPYAAKDNSRYVVTIYLSLLTSHYCYTQHLALLPLWSLQPITAW